MKKILGFIGCFVLVVIASMTLYACGESDKKAQITASNSEIELVLGTDQETKSVEFELKNFGNGSDQLNFSLEDNEKDFVSISPTPKKNGKTVLEVKGLSRGTAHIFVTSLQGSQKFVLTVKVIQPITGIELKNEYANSLYVVAGRTLSLSQQTIWNFIPSDTNQRDLDFSFVGESQGCEIIDGNLVVSDSCSLQSVTLQAVSSSNSEISTEFEVKILKPIQVVLSMDGKTVVENVSSSSEIQNYLEIFPTEKDESIYPNSKTVTLIVKAGSQDETLKIDKVFGTDLDKFSVLQTGYSYDSALKLHRYIFLIQANSQEAGNIDNVKFTVSYNGYNAGESNYVENSVVLNLYSYNKPDSVEVNGANKSVEIDIFENSINLTNGQMVEFSILPGNLKSGENYITIWAKDFENLPVSLYRLNATRTGYICVFGYDKNGNAVGNENGTIRYATISSGTKLYAFINSKYLLNVTNKSAQIYAQASAFCDFTATETSRALTNITFTINPNAKNVFIADKTESGLEVKQSETTIFAEYGKTITQYIAIDPASFTIGANSSVKIANGNIATIGTLSYYAKDENYVYGKFTIIPNKVGSTTLTVSLSDGKTVNFSLVVICPLEELEIDLEDVTYGGTVIESDIVPYKNISDTVVKINGIEVTRQLNKLSIANSGGSGVQLIKKAVPSNAQYYLEYKFFDFTIPDGKTLKTISISDIDVANLEWSSSSSIINTSRLVNSTLLEAINSGVEGNVLIRIDIKAMKSDGTYTEDPAGSLFYLVNFFVPIKGVSIKNGTIDVYSYDSIGDKFLDSNNISKSIGSFSVTVNPVNVGLIPTYLKNLEIFVNGSTVNISNLFVNDLLYLNADGVVTYNLSAATLKVTRKLEGNVYTFTIQALKSCDANFIFAMSISEINPDKKFTAISRVIITTAVEISEIEVINASEEDPIYIQNQLKSADDFKKIIIQEGVEVEVNDEEAYNNYVSSLIDDVYELELVYNIFANSEKEITNKSLEFEFNWDYLSEKDYYIDENGDKQFFAYMVGDKLTVVRVAYDYSDYFNLSEEERNLTTKDEKKKLAQFGANGTLVIYPTSNYYESTNGWNGEEPIVRIPIKVADGKSSDSAFEIYESEDLKLLGSSPASTFVLRNNIFMPVDYEPVENFMGKLSGRYQSEITPYGIYAIKPLFKMIAESGVVEDMFYYTAYLPELGYTFDEYVSTYNGVTYYGGLANINKGVIRNIGSNYNGTLDTKEILENAGDGMDVFGYMKAFQEHYGTKNSNADSLTTIKYKNVFNPSLSSSEASVAELFGFLALHDESRVINSNSAYGMYYGIEYKAGQLVKYTGGLVGLNLGTIEATDDSLTKGYMATGISGANIGGIAGVNEGKIINYTFIGGVVGVESAGGIVACNKGDLKDCKYINTVPFYANVTLLILNNSAYSYSNEINFSAGGICAVSESGNIYGCVVEAIYDIDQQKELIKFLPSDTGIVYVHYVEKINESAPKEYYNSIVNGTEYSGAKPFVWESISDDELKLYFDSTSGKFPAEWNALSTDQIFYRLNTTQREVYSGGLVGISSNTQISRSMFSGALPVKESNSGGLVGNLISDYNEATNLVLDCYSLVHYDVQNVNLGHSAGQFIYTGSLSEIKNCYIKSNVTSLPSACSATGTPVASFIAGTDKKTGLLDAFAAFSCFNVEGMEIIDAGQKSYKDLYNYGTATLNLQNKGWCSELYERQILGYNNTQVKVSYDDCNPFGVIAGDFGEITGLSKHTSKTASESTIVAFNTLSELFATFMNNFEIPTNGTEYIPTISSNALNSYTQFYNKAIELYNSSLVSFTKNESNDLTRSAVIGVNHPYTMAFGSDVSPELIDFQTVIANLFGFSSKTEFMNYAQDLADTYAQHRANIANSAATNEALDNGCFYTSNGSFVFPIAVKNELSSTVLAYVILDTSGLVSVWVNDITAALWATNFNSSYHTESIINNELYCKNILFVTGPNKVATLSRTYNEGATNKQSDEFTLSTSLTKHSSEDTSSYYLNIERFMLRGNEVYINSISYEDSLGVVRVYPEGGVTINLAEESNFTRTIVNYWNQIYETVGENENTYDVYKVVEYTRTVSNDGTLTLEFVIKYRKINQETGEETTESLRTETYSFKRTSSTDVSKLNLCFDVNVDSDFLNLNFYSFGNTTDSNYIPNIRFSSMGSLDLNSESQNDTYNGYFYDEETIKYKDFADVVYYSGYDTSVKVLDSSLNHVAINDLNLLYYKLYLIGLYNNFDDFMKESVWEKFSYYNPYFDDFKILTGEMTKDMIKDLYCSLFGLTGAYETDADLKTAITNVVENIIIPQINNSLADLKGDVATLKGQFNGTLTGDTGLGYDYGTKDLWLALYETAFGESGKSEAESILELAGNYIDTAQGISSISTVTLSNIENFFGYVDSIYNAQYQMLKLFSKFMEDDDILSGITTLKIKGTDYEQEVWILDLLRTLGPIYHDSAFMVPSVLGGVESFYSTSGIPSTCQGFKDVGWDIENLYDAGGNEIESDSVWVFEDGILPYLRGTKVSTWVENYKIEVNPESKLDKSKIIKGTYIADDYYIMFYNETYSDLAMDTKAQAQLDKLNSVELVDFLRIYDVNGIYEGSIADFSIHSSDINIIKIVNGRLQLVGTGYVTITIKPLFRSLASQDSDITKTIKIFVTNSVGAISIYEGINSNENLDGKEDVTIIKDRPSYFTVANKNVVSLNHNLFMLKTNPLAVQIDITYIDEEENVVSAYKTGESVNLFEVLGLTAGSETNKFAFGTITVSTNNGVLTDEDYHFNFNIDYQKTYINSLAENEWKKELIRNQEEFKTLTSEQINERKQVFIELFIARFQAVSEDAFNFGFNFKVAVRAERILLSVDKAEIDPSTVLSVDAELVSNRTSDRLIMKIIDENEKIVWISEDFGETKVENNSDLFNASIKNGTAHDGKISAKLLISIAENQRQLVNETKTYKIVLTDSNGDVEKSFNLVVKPQEIITVTYTHHNRDDASTESGIKIQDQPSSILVPGDSGILSINLFPAYATYSKIVLTSSVVNGNYVLMEQMYKSGDYFLSTSTTTGYSSERDVNILTIKNTNNSTGSIYVRTKILDSVKEGLYFPITIQIFAIDEDGNEYLSKVETITLISEVIEPASITINGEKDAVVARGTTAELKLTVGENQTLASFGLSEFDKSESSYDYASIYFNTSEYEIDNGKKIYSGTLTVGLDAEIEDDGYFKIQTIVQKIINGRLESTTDSIEIRVVDFLVEGITIEGNDEQDNVFDTPSAIEKDLKFNFKLSETPEMISASQESSINRINNAKEEFLKTVAYKFSNSQGYEYILNTDREFKAQESGGFTSDAKNIVYNLYYTSDMTPYISKSGEPQANKYFTIRYDNENATTLTIVGTSVGSVNMTIRIGYRLPNTKQDNFITYNFSINVQLYSDEDKPTPIETAEQFVTYLQSESEQYASTNYILMNDIVLENFVPFEKTNFASLDGNNKVITIKSFNLSQSTDILNLGLFVNVSEDATLKNLTVSYGLLEDIIVDETIFKSVNFGGIAVYNSGVIYNCEVVSLDIEGGDIKNGGIKIYFDSTKTKHKLDTTNVIIGGLVVENYTGASITNSRVGGKGSFTKVSYDAEKGTTTNSLDFVEFVIVGQ